MSGQARRPRRWLIAVNACLGSLIVAACSTSATASLPVRTGDPPTDQIPVIVDTDLDLSDIAAIAVLLRDPAVDVRAITIAGTGVVHCAAGRQVMRYLLDEMGSPDIPFGCGREDGGPDAHPFPDELRARADDGFGLDIPAASGSGVGRIAVDVIAEAVDASPSAPTLVTLGPLTNLEDTLARDETLADRLAGVQATLGTVDAPGNVFVNGLTGDDPLQWNAYADPSAVSAVLASDVPVSIVPLDAIDDVPVPADLADRLETDHQAAGADLVYELLVRAPERLRPEDGQQLSDELTALAIADADLVRWEDVAVTAEHDGRLVRDDAGKSIRSGASADRAGVESALLEALRRGDPRASPFTVGGRLAVTFDGTTCSVSGSSDEAGVHELTYQGPTGQPSETVVIGLEPPHTWAEVTALLPTFDPAATPPPWISLGPRATDADGAGTPVVASGSLPDGVAGVVCLTGEGTDMRSVPGASFPVGGGALPGR